MKFTRRKFLEDIVKSGTGIALSLPLIDCGSSSSSAGRSGNKSYVPEVNDLPYFNNGYFLGEDKTDSIGTAKFSVGEFEFWIAFESFHPFGIGYGDPIPNLEVFLYRDESNNFNR